MNTRRLAWVALTLWLVQLVLNAAWSWLFFGLREPGWALLEVLCLWVLIALTVVAFWRIRRLAAGVGCEVGARGTTLAYTPAPRPGRLRDLMHPMPA